jgi:hypothetical protein
VAADAFPACLWGEDFWIKWSNFDFCGQEDTRSHFCFVSALLFWRCEEQAADWGDGTGRVKAAYCFLEIRRQKMRTNRTAVVAMMIAATALMSGCRIESDKHGDNDNVKIATPFGGMSVKTNDAAVVDGLGLPVYPGAELVKKDKNNGAADVNMSFGSFQLRVKAASYRTQDSPDQVTAFYRKALGRYGDVIQCQNDKSVGTPTHTAEGLSCDNEKENHVYVNDDESGKMELKAGSKQHQHIVAIDTEGKGTKFGLVALDLPGHLSFGDKDDKQSQ